MRESLALRHEAVDRACKDQKLRNTKEYDSSRLKFLKISTEENNRSTINKIYQSLTLLVCQLPHDCLLEGPLALSVPRASEENEERKALLCQLLRVRQHYRSIIAPQLKYSATRVSGPSATQIEHENYEERTDLSILEGDLPNERNALLSHPGSGNIGGYQSIL